MRDKLKCGEKITLYPVGKEEGVDFRDSDNYLCVEEYAEEFAEHLEYFIRGYKVQMEMRLHENLVNSVSNVQGIFENYGTKYIVTTYQSGGIYTYHLDKSMYELFQIMKATSFVILEYHKLGYLHLDIKPDNIYKLKETSELVIMFDFDSFVRKDELSEGMIHNLSYTKEYAAPELLDLKLDFISEKTDIYAIGMMAYERLTSGTKYTGNIIYDLGSDLFKNVNPKVISLLNSFFAKTLSENVQERYETINDMLVDMDKILKVCQPSNPFIISNKPARNLQFVGREDILNLMHDTFTTQNVICLHGIGGIGKTEIANEYICRYYKDYEVTRRLVYSSSIKDMIVSDIGLPIHNFVRLSGESEDDYYNRKMNKLQEMCDRKVLFVVDNFDTEDDEELMDLLSLGCDFIFTSRYNIKNEYFYNMEIPIIERESLLKLFGMFCDYRKEEEETIVQLLDLVEQHTMSVELIAKQISASKITPREMYTLLTQKAKDSLQESISVYKDGRNTNKNMFAHIRNLFLHNKLDEQAKKILMSMTFFDSAMIELSTLQILLELKNYDAINYLERSGWIKFGYNEQKNTKQVYLHPIIKEFITAECKDEVIYVEDFFYNVAMKLSVLHEKDGKLEIQLEQNLLKNILIHLCRNERILAEWDYGYWGVNVFGSIGDYLLYAGEYLFMENISDSFIAFGDKIQPDYVFVSWYVKAVIYHELKKYEEEIRYKLQCIDMILKKQIEEKGALATLYYEVGVCYSRLGDAVNAKKYYKKGGKACFRYPSSSLNYNTGIAMVWLLGRAEILFYKGKVDKAKKMCRIIALDGPNYSKYTQFYQKIDSILHISVMNRMYSAFIFASELMIMMGEKTEDKYFIEQGKISRYMLASKVYGDWSLEACRYLKDLIIHHIQKEEYEFSMRLVKDYVKAMRGIYAGDDSLHLDFWCEVFTLLHDKERYGEIITVYEYHIIGEGFTDSQVCLITKILSFVAESYLACEKQTEAQMAYFRLQQIVESKK